METIARVTTALQTVLGGTAETAARATEAVKRRGKLSGAQWVQTLVLGWLAKPDARLTDLSQTAAHLGVALSPQGLDQRFTREGAACLESVLAATLTEVVTADAPATQPLLDRFTAVYVQDTTTITLPDALQDEWRGCGGRTTVGTAAAVKAQVRIDLRQGTLHGPDLEDGRTHDQRLAPAAQDLPTGALVLQDLAYFCLATLAAYAAAGVWWLTRLKVNTAVFDATGRRWEVGMLLAAQAQGGPAIERPVTLGVTQRLPTRLLAVRVPPLVAAERRRKLRLAAKRKGALASAARLALADWTVVVTNVPAAQLTVAEALVLYRARWQIEVVFHLWKSQGQVAVWRSRQPWRILCEVYAKLIGLVIQHWVLLTGAWRHAGRSLWHAGQTVRQFALPLLAALADAVRLAAELTRAAFCLVAGCRINPRRTHPNTHQLLADPPPLCFA